MYYLLYWSILYNVFFAILWCCIMFYYNICCFIILCSILILYFSILYYITSIWNILHFIWHYNYMFIKLYCNFLYCVLSCFIILVNLYYSILFSILDYIVCCIDIIILIALFIVIVFRYDTVVGTLQLMWLCQNCRPSTKYKINEQTCTLRRATTLFIVYHASRWVQMHEQEREIVMPRVTLFLGDNSKEEPCVR